MKIRELIRYSGRLLEGRRARTMMICLLPAAAELFFRFAEAAVFSLLLYFGGSMPIELFSGSSAALSYGSMYPAQMADGCSAYVRGGAEALPHHR